MQRLKEQSLSLCSRTLLPGSLHLLLHFPSFPPYRMASSRPSFPNSPVAQDRPPGAMSNWMTFHSCLAASAHSEGLSNDFHSIFYFRPYKETLLMNECLYLNSPALPPNLLLFLKATLHSAQTLLSSSAHHLPKPRPHREASTVIVELEGESLSPWACLMLHGQAQNVPHLPQAPPHGLPHHSKCLVQATNQINVGFDHFSVFTLTDLQQH